MDSLNKIARPLGLTLILVIGIFGRCALAHTMWLNLSDYSPRNGGNIVVYFGWGHKYPIDDFLDQERFLKKFSLINPKGKAKTLSPNSGGFLATRIDSLQEGTYVVAAELNPGFYTMYLKDGELHHKIGPKTGIDNVILSLYFEQFAKAIFNVGAGDSSFVLPIGHRLEIVPLKNPNVLKEDDYLPIRILFDGEAVRFYPKVYATYLGFSTKDETYAYTTVTNDEGIAEIKIIRSGIWMIKVDYKKCPSDELKDKCDHMSYTATLSFEVK